MSDFKDIKELMKECYDKGRSNGSNGFREDFEWECAYELRLLEDMPLFATEKPVQSDKA